MRESNCRFEEKFQLCNGVFDYCGVWICPEISTKATTSPSPKLVRYRNFMKSKEREAATAKRNRLHKQDSSPPPALLPLLPAMPNLPPPTKESIRSLLLSSPFPQDSFHPSTMTNSVTPLPPRPSKTDRKGHHDSSPGTSKEIRFRHFFSTSPRPPPPLSLPDADIEGSIADQAASSTSFLPASQRSPSSAPTLKPPDVIGATSENSELSHSRSSSWRRERKPKIIGIYANGRQIFPHEEEEAIPRLEIIAKVEYPSKLDAVAERRAKTETFQAPPTTERAKSKTPSPYFPTTGLESFSTSVLLSALSPSFPPQKANSTSALPAAPALTTAAAATGSLRFLPSAFAEEGEGLPEKLRCG